MRRDELVDLFKRLHEDVETRCGVLILAFGIGPSEMYPKPRNYAFYMEPENAIHFNADGRTGLILVAPRMLEATKDRAEAIKGNERRADALAETLWGTPIRYDCATLQSLKHGITPRPLYLGE